MIAISNDLLSRTYGSKIESPDHWPAKLRNHLKMHARAEAPLLLLLGTAPPELVTVPGTGGLRSALGAPRSCKARRRSNAPWYCEQAQRSRSAKRGAQTHGRPGPARCSRTYGEL